ncbi:MAG: hypothetical protein IT579_02045 [Verrucomicrobia subdivision 3 bacterium]|nr:hypothetical protein [Verrucomicrobiota bacterium]MCC6819486.1 hypothetical protein [Limisphaerales bacterium]
MIELLVVIAITGSMTNTMARRAAR